MAELLAKLTTKDGGLPQGTKTSNQLANLVFWGDEWQVVADLHARGIVYTRLIDDITCSSKKDLSAEQTGEIITTLHGMVHRNGLELNDSKRNIARAGDRQETTKLVVNVKPALPSEKRSAIRAAVHKLINRPVELRATLRYQQEYRQVSGKVSYLKQHHAPEATRLRSILQSLPAPKARSKENDCQSGVRAVEGASGRTD